MSVYRSQVGGQTRVERDRSGHSCYLSVVVRSSQPNVHFLGLKQAHPKDASTSLEKGRAAVDCGSD